MTDLFGLSISDLETARRTVEPILGVEMDAHESSYRCGDYYLKRFPNGDEFSLQKNHDRVHDEWRFEEFTEMGTLLFVSVSDSDRLEDMNSRLKGVDGLFHLQRESFSKEGGYKLVKVHKGKI